MIEFSVLIQKFDEQGEKTGWTYILIPEAIANQLKENNRRSFRVKGFLDNYRINGISLLPMGEGDFIMPLKAELRKAIGKQKGARLKVKLEEDKKKPEIYPPLIQCLEDEPVAKAYFNSLPLSHRFYYSKWIESAKTDTTRVKRLSQTISALAKKQSYNIMLRAERDLNK